MRKLLVLVLAAALLTGDVLVPLSLVQATVNEVTAVNRYVANGTVTVFAYTFKIFLKTDIEVVVDGVTKTVDTHYTVSGLGASGGGSVTFLMAPLNNAKVTLLRKQPANQLSTYFANEPFPAARLEKDYDKLAMQVQQAKEVNLRGLFFKKNSTISGGTLDDWVAGKYARVNGGATGLEWVSLTATGTYADPITTKGDLLVGGATGLSSRLGVGADDCYLRALASEATGLSWATCGTMPVSLGGTGLTSGTSGGITYFNSTSTMVSSALLSLNGPVVGGGAGGAPASVTVGSNGQVLAVDTNQSPTHKYINVAGESFHGVIRSHPDSDVVNTKLRADLSVATMNDGHVYTPGQGLVFDKTVTGSIGGMQAAAVNSTWNKLYYARKRSDGSEGLWGLRAKNYLADTSFTTATDSINTLREAAANTKIAQSFQLTNAGKLEVIDALLAKQGAPTGNHWYTVEADSSGSPSGTPLATSDKYDVSRMSTADTWVRFPFRAPATLSSATTYWLVYQGDFTISGANYMQWRSVGAGGYANGSAKTFDGVSTWSADGNLDNLFKTYITQNDTAISLPAGYDQYVQIGWFYIDGSGNIKKFMAVDRKVWTAHAAAWKIGTLAGTNNHALTDVSAFLPPVPCITDLAFAGDTTAMGLGAAHISTTDSGNTDSVFQTSFLVSDIATTVPFYLGGGLLTEYHGLVLVNMSPGTTGAFWVHTFEW